jgi:hypothetical protein
MPDPAAEPVLLADLLAAVRASLTQPGGEVSAIYDVADAVDVTLRLAWEKATGTPPERLAAALQAAGELLDALGLALAEGQGKAEG